MSEKQPETESPSDIPSWMDWGNLREKIGEIAGRIIAIERQFSEFRAEVNQRFAELREEVNQRFTELREETNQRFTELREEMNQHFGEVNQHFGEVSQRFGEVSQRFGEVNQRFGEMYRKQDRLLYLMLAVALGMVANLAYFALTS